MDHGYVDNGGGVDTGNAKEFLFLQEKVLEVAREGDTKEMRYLMGISAAQRLLGAHDQVLWVSRSLQHFVEEIGARTIVVLSTPFEDLPKRCPVT